MEDLERIQREEAVQGFNGGSLADALRPSLIFAAAYGLHLMSGVMTPRWVPRIVRDVLQFACMLIPCLGLLEPLGGGVTLSVVCMVTFVVFSMTPLGRDRGKEGPRGRRRSVVSHTQEPLPGDKWPPSLIFYNAFLTFLTTFVILAVDFQLFPRTFVKRERFGYSLMDFGTGLFVAKAGFLSAVPRAKEQGRRAAIASEVLRSLPLLVLGVGRAGIIVATNYQTHVSEYGTHWNFFITLFCVRVLAVPLRNLSAALLAVTSVLIPLLYQLALSLGAGSLSAYLLDAPRTNVLSHNREGLFGVVGYL
eukprot:CAMPEP_0119144888 /NCGR_PEP_ID=MMETSP1310-20130426/36678_1 /TAXON_ID=464262 /ORGANISM="Genus nov. species nov., Strain RCC2339" /LENGTH=305 /DNA_ID=CAMNT_0007136669 /DNA_START=49 /DNA_END=962 /DNA_ORIENTATION=+